MLLHPIFSRFAAARRASRAAGGVAPFSPEDAGALLLWLDAGVGTYSDTGMTTLQTTDAGAVAGWASRTGSNHVTEAAAGVTLRTNVLNGLPVLRFNAAGYLRSAALGATDAMPNTLFCVAKKRLNDSAIQYVVHGRVSTANVQRNTIGYNSASNQFRIAGSSTIAAAGTVTNWNVVAGLFDGTSSKAWVSGAAATTGSTGSVGLSGFTIGGEADGTVLLDGDVAEILVYSGGLSDTQVAQVGGYLATKYGLTWT